MHRGAPEDLIGVYFCYHKNERFHYIKLNENFQSTLAYRAGIKNYDRVVTFNGINIEQMTVEEFMKHFEEQRHLPVELLVCSPSTYAHYRSKKTKIHSGLPTVKRLKPVYNEKKNIGQFHTIDLEYRNTKQSSRTLQ